MKYKVQKGDTLWLIAKKYGVNLEALIAANPQIADPDKIDVGDVITIPGKANVHIVQKGDTMWLIAKKYGVSLEELIEANPQISDPNKIDVKMEIKIPGGVNAEAKYMESDHPMVKKTMPKTMEPVTMSQTLGSEWPDHLKTMVYVVKTGDTLFKIAKMFGVSLQKVISSNPQIADPDKIYPGNKVYVPVEKEYIEKKYSYSSQDKQAMKPPMASMEPMTQTPMASMPPMTPMAPMTQAPMASMAPMTQTQMMPTMQQPCPMMHQCPYLHMMHMTHMMHMMQHMQMPHMMQHMQMPDKQGMQMQMPCTSKHHMHHSSDKGCSHSSSS